MFSLRLLRWLTRLGVRWDGWRGRLGLGQGTPIAIQAYRGFGGRDFLCLSGRVLRDKFITKAERDSAWRNFNNTLKRFNSREINGANVRVYFAGQVFDLQTDNEGYFTLDTQLAQTLPPAPERPPFWQRARVELLGIPGAELYQIQQAEVLIPGAKAKFGVISDIDDTILQTYVTSWLKWRMIYLTLLKNAFSRQAFPHSAAFFQALRRGASGYCYNPFFYVSNSPWNLYDLLAEFLDLNKLPRGPVLLRDFGLPSQERPVRYRGHKHEQIVRLLNLYPGLPFVLIGDSGERDAAIYQAVCSEFPGRIRAVYIRDVGDAPRAQGAQQQLDGIADVPCLLVSDYKTAAQHAAQCGLLDMRYFQQID